MSISFDALKGKEIPNVKEGSRRDYCDNPPDKEAQKILEEQKGRQ